MGKQGIGTVISINVLISAAFTFIAYIYNLFNLGDMVRLRDFLLSGQPFVIDYVAQSSIIRYMPMFPVLLAWFFIGALVYFFYYSLANVYGIVYNQMLIRGYVKAEKKEDFSQELKSLERLAIHVLVISSFVLFIIIYILVLLPLSRNVSLFADTFATRQNFGQLATTTIPLLALYIYWTVLVAIVQGAWHFVRKLEDYETFKAEHEAI